MTGDARVEPETVVVKVGDADVAYSAVLAAGLSFEIFWP